MNWGEGNVCQRLGDDGIEARSDIAEKGAAIMQRELVVPVVVAAVVMLGLAGARPVSRGQPGSQAEREVLKVEEEMDRAFAKGDTAVLDRIWADDVIYTSASGQVFTKAQYLDRFRSGTRKFDSFAHDDVRVRLYGNMAVLTGRSMSVLHDGSKRSAGPRRFTHIYVKQDGRWRLVAHHVTNVAKE